MGILFVALFIVVRADDVRISFLNEPSVLEKSLKVFEASALSAERRSNFANAVKAYYSEGFVFDFTQFPPKSQGFYSFQSMDRLVKAFGSPLSETEHRWDLNCFDAVFLLASEKFDFELKTKTPSGPFFAPVTATNALVIRPCATAADAFSLSYPAWYRAESDRYFPGVDEMEARVSLTALLFTAYVLPLNLDESELPKIVLSSLQERWKRYGLRCDPKIELVLGHEVNYSGRYFVTSHAGLLMRNGRGLMYVEKVGGTGPFVRLDLQKRSDLEQWFGNIYKDAKANGYSHHFISFGHEKIRPLNLH